MELILGILGVIALHLLAAELYAHSRSLARRLIGFAARRLPGSIRSRYHEEWLAHLDECSGNLAKVAHALECVLCARSIRRIASKENELYAIGIEATNFNEKRVANIDPSTIVFLLEGMAKSFSKDDPKQSDDLRTKANMLRRKHVVGKPDFDKVKEVLEVMGLAIESERRAQPPAQND